MQSPTSTSPVARSGLAVPSGRARTVPVTRSDVLRPQVVSAVDDALDDAGVVAQVDEGQVLAVLAPARHPAAQRHLPADVAGPQLAAVVGAHHQVLLAQVA